jgi:hypothetical protein
MMFGISPSVALFLLLVCGLILLAMIGFAYLILKSLSPSHAVQLSPPDLDAKQQNTSSPSVPSRENRWPQAIVVGVAWFVLWVVYTNILPRMPGHGVHRYLMTEAFGYATASIVSLVGVTWCAIWLWKRFARSRQ